MSNWYLDVLKDIGSIKCKKCNGICLLDIYAYWFRCQNCGTIYYFETEEE